MGRRGWASSAAINGFKCCFHIIRMPFSVTYKGKGSGDVAYLMMQERSSFSMNMNLITAGLNIKPVKRPKGRFCLTLACPKAGKIMAPQQMFGSPYHKLWIEPVLVVPNAACIKCRWLSPRQNTVEIAPS